MKEQRVTGELRRTSRFRPMFGSPLVARAVALLVSLSILVTGGAPGVLAAGDCPGPNDTAEKACELKIGQSVSDELANDRDEDRLKLDVKDGQTVEVTAKSTAPVGGIKLRLEDADGNAVAAVGLGPGEREVLAERLPAGRYIVTLSGEGGDPGRSYGYSIKWNGTDTDGP